MRRMAKKGVLLLFLLFFVSFCSSSFAEGLVDVVDMNENNCVAYGGEWSFEDQAITLSGSNVPWPKLIVPGYFTNYIIEADLIGVREGGFVFRTNHESSGSDNFGGYYIGYDSAYAFAGKDVNGWNTINLGLDAPAACPLEYREEMHWKIVVSGNTFTLFVDDMSRPLIQIGDDTFPSGGFGIRIRYRDGDRPASIRNLTITEIDDSQAEYNDLSLSQYDRWAIRLVDQNPPEQNQGKLICIGTSHVEFWDSLVEDFQPLPALNFGMGGSWVEHISGKNDLWLTPYKPCGVLVLTGGNDISGGRDTDSIIRDTQALLQSIRTDLPNVPIFYISCFNRPEFDQARYSAVKAVNDAMIAFCDAGDGIIYIDAESATLLPDGSVDRSMFRDDGIHFNKRGYQAIAGVIVPIVQKEIDKADQGTGSLDDHAEEAASNSANLNWPLLFGGLAAIGGLTVLALVLIRKKL